MATVIDNGSATPGDAQPFVTLRLVGAIAELGLNSCPLNLVNKEMLRDFNRILGEVTERPEIRCLILHGGNARGGLRSSWGDDHGNAIDSR